MGISFSDINSISQAAIKDSRTFVEASDGNFSDSELDDSIEEDANNRNLTSRGRDLYESIYRSAIEAHTLSLEDEYEDED